MLQVPPLKDLSEACVWDCETNGLLPWQVKDGEPHVTTFHCAWIYDIAKDEYRGYGPEQLTAFLDDLASFKVRIGHNVMGYDEQVLEFLFGDAWTTIRPADSIVIDTLILAKMLYPADDLLGRDMKLYHQQRLPGGLLKRQSLEAWGYRLGQMKGDYSAMMKAKGLDPWATFNEDMYAYNRQDVVVNWELLKLCWRRLGWGYLPEGKDAEFVWTEQAVWIEHRTWSVCLDDERTGFGFDYAAAMRLQADLENQKAVLDAKLVEVFGSWWQPVGCDPKVGITASSTVRRKQTQLPNITVRRFSEKTGRELKPYVGPPIAETPEGATYVPIKRVTFNPSSRAHLGNRLVTLFGWQPTSYGGRDGTQPVVDEGSIKAIPDDVLDPELRRVILDFFKLDKALGQLSKGAESWMLNYRPSTGAIHGRTDPLGTITHRAAHNKPNKAQVPAVSLDETKDAAGRVIKKTPILGVKGGFGWECRSLWVPKAPFRFQIGTDASGLELLCLGHYLAPLDGGVFAARVSDPDLDIHTANASITGLTRAETKTVTYAFLYGSGPLLIGVAVGVTDEEVEALWDHNSVKSWMRFTKKLHGDSWKEPTKLQRAQYMKGKQIIAAFLAGIDGLEELRKGTSNAADTRGWVKGLDGRRLSTRKAHAALNTLLQSCGAIICKYWMVRVHDLLSERGLIKGVHWNQVAWVHDELQIEYLEEWMGEVIGQISKQAIAQVGRELGFRADLKADFKLGHSWAECH